MPENLRLGQGVNDNGQQDRGLAWIDENNSAGHEMAVRHAACTFCGFEYFTYYNSMKKRRCPQCHNGTPPIELPEGVNCQRPSFPPARLSPADVARVLVQTRNVKIPKRTLDYAISDSSGAMVMNGKPVEVDPPARPPASPFPPASLFPPEKSKRTGLDDVHHLPLKFQRYSSVQDRLALDDGDLKGWSDADVQHAAIKIRKMYLTSRGVDAAEWNLISDSAQSLWLSMVNAVVGHYQKSVGKSGLRTDI